MIDLSLKAKNFKSIGSNEEGFEAIYPINIVIGRNNTGKSTLLDLVNYAISPSDINHLGHKGTIPEVYLSKPLSDQEIKGTFPDNTSGGPIGENHLQFGMKWLNKRIKIRLLSNTREYVSTDPEFTAGTEYLGKLTTNFINLLNGKTFRRIRADRDIGPEGDGQVNVLENGSGATNIIQVFYTKANRDRTLITKNLLDALNSIFSPSLTFNELVVRQNDNGAWELYLNEESKGLIALSNSGSGLKTVILVLVNLLLIPKFENKPLNNYVFAFEELENNLHPGLQRSLFNYIREVAIKEGAYFFLTTHSNVVIDLFNKDESSQIVHVTHNGEFSTVKKIITYIENRGILDDLDIRASDLLQANGVVWLEGPSDRLYFNRWIELWSNGELKEGTHYQCIFYGGRLLAHLSALQEEEGEEKGVNILKVNNHAVLLLDSDKDEETDTLNATKNRLITEIGSVAGFSWVTSGREVENYIPMNALNQAYGDSSFTEVAPFDKFEDYMNNRKQGEGDKFLKNKVLFAEKILANLTKEDLEPVLDLKQKLDEVCKIIRSWNSM